MFFFSQVVFELQSYVLKHIYLVQKTIVVLHNIIVLFLMYLISQ